PLSQRHHAQARALSYPVEQGVKLRTERLTHGRRNRRKFLRELEKRMAEAKTATCSRKQGAHTHRGAVKAIGEHPADAIRRLLLGGRALKLAIERGQGRCTRLLSVAEMPDHAVTDNRGQIDLLRETATMLLVGQDRDRQWQPAPGQHRHQTLVAQGAEQAVECHGERRYSTAHRSKLSPPSVAPSASPAPSE